MSNEEIQEAVARSEAEYEMLKDKVHDQYDEIQELKQKVNQYENPDDLTLFYMWLDEKSKGKMKELQDEIQNLKGSLKTYEVLLKTNVEENERLKELCDKYEEEHSNAFKLWTMKMEEMPCYEEFMNYKSRNEKAIEDINLLMSGRYCKDNVGYMSQSCCNLRLEIIKKDLAGGDKE